jgi:hypothetical protein
MESQGRPTSSANQNESTAAGKAIAEVIAEAITEATTPNIATVARIIVAQLKGPELSNEPDVTSTAIEVKIGESVSTAVKAAMADVVHGPVMDVTALRTQIIGSLPHSLMSCTCSLTQPTANIEFLHDLMTDLSHPVQRNYSAPKLVTTVDGHQHFSASVVRIELEPDEGTLPDVTIEVHGCESDIEALQKLHRLSQGVLFHARSLSHDALIQARFDFWDDLEDINWGEGCRMRVGWC